MAQQSAVPWWEPLFVDGQPQSATDAQVDCLLDALEPRSRVLDLACATGRHAVALALRGFDIVGVDISERHLEQARDRAAAAGATLSFVADDMRDLRAFDDASFDAVVSVYSSFGFLPDDDNRRALAQVGRVLRPGGVLFIDVLNRDWVLRSLAPSCFAEQAADFVIRDYEQRDDGVVLHEDRFDPVTSRLSWRITHLDREGNSSVAPPRDARLFSLHEVHDMLAAHGLTIRRTLGAYDGSPFDLGSRRIIAVAGKDES